MGSVFLRRVKEKKAELHDILRQSEAPWLQRFALSTGGRRRGNARVRDTCSTLGWFYLHVYVLLKWVNCVVVVVVVILTRVYIVKFLSFLTF